MASCVDCEFSVDGDDADRLFKHGVLAQTSDGVVCVRCREVRALDSMPMPDSPSVPSNMTLRQVVRVLGCDTRLDRDAVVRAQGEVISRRYKELSHKFSFEASETRAREEWLARWLKTKK